MRPQIVKRIILIVFCFFANAIVLAQTGGSAGPPNPGQTRGPELPIDENMLLLLVAGILYGSYIAYKRQRIKNTQR